MNKITKDTTIGDIVDNYEGAKDILGGYGMHCFGCPMSRMETLEEASSVHGVAVEEVLKSLEEAGMTNIVAVDESDYDGESDGGEG